MIFHNQSGSGQLWDFVVDLENGLITNDNPSTPWNSAPTFYDGMIEDFFANADNHFGEDTDDLKDLTQPFDRIGLLDATLNITLQSGQGSADYTGPTQFFDFPQGTNVVPFIIVKGHRLGSDSDELAVIAWIDPNPPAHQGSSDGVTRDILGKMVSEPGSIAVWSVVVALGLVRTRRS